MTPCAGMSDAVGAVVYAVVLFGAVWATGGRLEGEGAPPRRFPRATVTALVLVGIPSVVQLTLVPSLLDHLERNRSAIGHGELWRLVTSLVVQDGGVGGTVSNLAYLAFVGAVAEQVWSRRRWSTIALGAGIGGELWGLVVQPVGGGNSVMHFGLAGSLAVAALQRGPAGPRAIAAVSLLGAAVLLVSGDIHGGAATIGAALAVLLIRSDRSEPGGRRRGAPS